MGIWIVFPFLAIMNNAARNLLYRFSYRHVFSVLLGMYLRVELLGHMVNLSLSC